MAKEYTKHGFSTSISNVDKLERIFDLIEDKWRIEIIGISHCYFVYNKDAITEEVQMLQKALVKPFWSYKRYNTNIGGKIKAAFTEDDWKEFLKKNEEQQNRIKENKVIRVKIQDEYEQEFDEMINYEYEYGKQSDIKNNCYIYGIKVDGELVYIGKTTRTLQERIKEHIGCVLDKTISNSQQKYLYEAMRTCQIGYKFEILYESHNIISNHELEVIEKSFIENMKPKYNYEGVKIPYRFTK